jgi:hypothetical protein
VYFPQIGDAEETVTQKKASRLQAEQQMLVGAGNAATPEQRAPTAPEAPRAPAPSGGGWSIVKP